MLYPATSAIYRSLGWEIAGVRDELRSRPARCARWPPRTSCSRRPDEAAAAAAAAPLRPGRRGRGAGRARPRRTRPCGTAARTPGTRRRSARWLGDEQRFCLPGAGRVPRLPLAGTATTRSWWTGSWPASAATTRAIWAVVASHSSIADTVQACVGPADPVQLADRPNPTSPGRAGTRGCCGWSTRPRRWPSAASRPRSRLTAVSGWPTRPARPMHGLVDAGRRRRQGHAHPAGARRGRRSRARATRVRRAVRGHPAGHAAPGRAGQPAGPRRPTPRWTPRSPPTRSCSTTSDRRCAPARAPGRAGRAGPVGSVPAPNTCSSAGSDGQGCGAHRCGCSASIPG